MWEEELRRGKQYASGLFLHTIFYLHYLQSHTFATAGCISKDKPIMLCVRWLSLTCNEVNIFIVIFSLTDRKFDVSAVQSCNCVYKQYFLPRYPSTTSYQGLKWKSVPVNRWHKMDARSAFAYLQLHFQERQLILLNGISLMITDESLPNCGQRFVWISSGTTNQNCHKKIHAKEKKLSKA